MLRDSINIFFSKQDLILCLSSVLKSDSCVPKKVCFICFNNSPLKVMKNAFYFILKPLFVLKTFKFLSWLIWSCGKTAWKEAKVAFKIYDVTTWEISIYNTHAVNISKSKGNQTMQFGQLIRYIVGNIFLQNSCI